MKINLSNLFLVATVILLIGYIYYDKTTNNSRMSTIDNKIDSLEQCISDKQIAIDSITIKTQLLNDSIAHFEKNIKTYKSQLQEVKNKYAKIKSTSSATPADVTDFFSDRYGK